MKREWTNDEVDYLFDELASARNMISLAIVALENEENYLVPTAIETAYEQLQGLIDEFCVVRM